MDEAEEVLIGIAEAEAAALSPEVVAEMAAYVAAMPAVTLRNTVVLSTAIRAIVLKNALSERAPGAPAARPMPALAGTAPLPGVRGAWQPGSPR